MRRLLLLRVDDVVLLGEHFTPREVIRLIVNLLFGEDSDVLTGTAPCDLVLCTGDRPLAVVEVKVLDGLGPRQLDRITAAPALSGARRFVLIAPHGLAVDPRSAERWIERSWEQVLDAYRDSGHPSVAATAEAWWAHLGRSLPRVGPETVWNQVSDGEDLVLALRARMALLHRQLHPSPPVRHDLVTAANGRSAVARLYADTPVSDYQIMVDIQERLPVQEFPKAGSRQHPRLRGPRVLVALLQQDVRTAEGFDWHHLRSLWPVMEQAPLNWSTRPARPRTESDRRAHAAMVATGGPPHLGFGFGEKQANRFGACMFGAQAHLPADIRLADLRVTARQIERLVRDLAAIDPRVHRATEGPLRRCPATGVADMVKACRCPTGSGKRAFPRERRTAVPRAVGQVG